jgi:hypothetical protein
MDRKGGGIITETEAREILGVRSAYPLHDRDYQLEFVLGMWFHTRDLAGKPTPLEVDLTLPDWPEHRRADLVLMLGRREQLAFPSLAIAA